MLHRHDQHEDDADLHRRCGRDDKLAALELQIAEDLDRQRRHAGAGEEQRRVELAERKGEGEQRTGNDAGPDQRQGDEAEGR